MFHPDLERTGNLKTKGGTLRIGGRLFRLANQPVYLVQPAKRLWSSYQSHPQSGWTAIGTGSKMASTRPFSCPARQPPSRSHKGPRRLRFLSNYNHHGHLIPSLPARPIRGDGLFYATAPSRAPHVTLAFPSIPTWPLQSCPERPSWWQPLGAVSSKAAPSLGCIGVMGFSRLSCTFAEGRYHYALANLPSKDYF
jgi:hypothetical protein